jgi:NDP-sugar pyrophosphorylase family protein
LDAVPPALPADLGAHVLPELIRRGEPVYGYRMTRGLWWFDTPAEYEAARHDVRLASYAAANGGCRSQPEERRATSR